MLKIIKIYIKLICYYFFCLLPINNKKILFQSLNKKISDNPKYIFEDLLNKNLDLDYIWVADYNNEYGDECRVVRPMSLEYLYHMATARVIVGNYRKIFLFRKRKNQKYIQTWHGTPLKKIEKDVENKLSLIYKLNAKFDSKDCDLMISGNGHTTSVMRKSFWYDGPILNSGTPRNDLLFKNSKESKEKILNFLNVDKSKKIITYAPTFRGNCESSLVKFNPLNILNELSKTEDWIFIVRLHPNIYNKVDVNRHMQIDNIRVFDLSSYPDMTELLCATDILLTDYSSTMFDFLHTKKPCILYTYDEDLYINDDRGSYFELDNLPFQRVKTFDELLETLGNKNLYMSSVNYDNFIKKMQNYDNGRSAEIISDKILEFLG